MRTDLLALLTRDMLGIRSRPQTTCDLIGRYSAALPLSNALCREHHVKPMFRGEVAEKSQIGII
ncbi:hypothetical protein MMB17_17565 [Methylobacterium organophilum]|uniref:hypothetical protein n=1 Tax=Methylobacterium organophilum TaxID=410 RepID=UPI001F12A8F3|nr:hypothetical protein [Methylobacterium organophilum]UMY20289.1 hypothetical protein MMB17_17565 [Methylobacterium organophilum]